MQEIRVTKRGAERWTQGHPWIFASDVTSDEGSAGVATVSDHRGKAIGKALYSPASEIRVRLLDRRPEATIDQTWWRERITRALARRGPIDASAYRVVHGEGDGLPSLIIDRYDRWVVVQILSAGLETCRSDIVAAVLDVLAPEGILARHDPNVRRREGLPQEIVLLYGTVPEDLRVREGPIEYLAAPWSGQKTGAFLDQRINRLKAGQLMPAGGRGLDCFSYHGSFALHLARQARSVVAMDVSAEALTRGQANAGLNGFTNLTWLEADAFEGLRDLDRAKERFDVVVVDPPAFAKNKGSVHQALKGYKDINLRAIRLVSPGGHLVTASCSYHVRWPEFLGMLAEAAADSGRRVTLVEHLTQPSDHPEVLTIPETGYLKGAVLRVEPGSG